MNMGHLKRLLAFVAAGSSIFTLFILMLQVELVRAGQAPDPTVYDFYPIMAALGAAFGVERWWAHEQGEYNPVRER